MTGPDRPAVIGVDPGETTGIAVLDLTDLSAALIQCTPDAALHIVRSFSFGQLVRVAVEQFVVGPRAGRSAHARAGRTARELIGELLGAQDELGAPLVLRSAAEVKPWATDERLAAAGLAAPGMRHARDGARHALFAACRDCGVPDPLSRTFRTRHRSPR